MPVRTFFLAIFFAVLTARVYAGQGSVDFNRDIRPILSDRCFTCHGPDEAKRKSKMRLDIRDEAFKPAKSGLVPIIAGKAEQSELIKRITAVADEDHMP